MSLRKDVYELLCLYVGPHPREAFKPRLQPKDWREREKARLIFRSQVPDCLEAAYDIALGAGYVESYLLEPNRQVELYRLHGTYDVPQDEPWPVFPAWSDALIVVTDKGRAAIGAHTTDSTVLSQRLTVDLARKTLMLDGTEYEVKSEPALRWLRVLAEHPGEWISSKDLEGIDPELMTTRTDKLKRFLPDALLDLIESETGAGSRLVLGRK